MKLTKSFSQYGASMGRSNNVTEPLHPVKLQLAVVTLDRGGYDNGGAYWGHGERLYRAWGDGENELQEYFLRAGSREEARARVRAVFKNCKFYR